MDADEASSFDWMRNGRSILTWLTGFGPPGCTSAVAALKIPAETAAFFSTLGSHVSAAAHFRILRLKQADYQPDFREPPEPVTPGLDHKKWALVRGTWCFPYCDS